MRQSRICLAAWALMGIGLAGTPPAPAASCRVPDDGRIQLTDYGFRDWGPELLRYSVDTERFRPGRLVLLDGEGKPVPFQIEGDALEFVATVRKGQTATYTLQKADRDRSRENSTLTHRTSRGAAEVGNEFFGLRLPRPQKKEFRRPVAAAEVTPPILAWKQKTSEISKTPEASPWVGGAHFFTERKVASVEIRAVEDGPATVAYEARYRFEPKGEYVWHVRVSTGVPVALVTEEYDFGEVTEGHDFLMLGLGENWQPQEIGFLTGMGVTTASKPEPIGPYLEAKGKEQIGPVKNVGAYPPPAPFVPGQGLTLLDKIVPGGTWGLKAGMELRKPGLSVSVCPYNTGSWRRTNSLLAWHDPARGVLLALPIGVRRSHWYLDLTDDRSPFSSHEHDPDLPASYGRRVWALGLGLDAAAPRLWPDFAADMKKPSAQGLITDPIVKTRTVLGYIGLDRYKDWVLDWPEDKAKAIYPRGLATPEIAARLKAVLDQHPEKEHLSKLYMIVDAGASGSPSPRGSVGTSKEKSDETGAANAKAALAAFKRGTEDWANFALTGYGQTYQYLWTVHADSALAWPSLPPEQRRDLRRFLALYSYLLSEPDYNPRGAGVHLGNPNMPIGRTSALALVAPLIPDHPLYGYWMAQLKDITAFRLAINTEPGGAWFEPPIYQFYGPTRALTLAQIILRNAGVADLTKEGWHKAALTYDANLTVPEARAKGWRVFPGMGNSGLTLEGIFGISMGAFDQSDRDFAGFLRFMHRLTSGNERVSLGSDPDYSLCFLPDVPEKPRTLTTTFIPGYGVAFRAHFGLPDETALLFRCGYNHSHWDMDDLNVILVARGAPLSPGTGYQYYYGPATQNEAIYHNRVKVGKLTAHEPFGRIENVILDYGFGDSADYALGREYYPPEYFEEAKQEGVGGRGLGVGGKEQDRRSTASGQSGMEWRRHILFLKSPKPNGPSYFVLRDTFSVPALPKASDSATSSAPPLREGKSGNPAQAQSLREVAAWWHWLNLDTADLIAVDGKPFEKDKTPFNKVVPESEMPVLTGRTIDMWTKFGAGTHFWFATKEPFTARVVMTFDYPLGPNYHHRAFGKALGIIDQNDKETKTIVRVAGTAAEGFFYVVYPRRDAEKAPACAALDDGCIKVVTGEATDYAFVSDSPLRFDKEEVVFTGKAGAVRLFPDRVVLCLNSGSGQVGYKGHVFEGHGPFERTVRLADLKPGLHPIPTRPEGPPSGRPSASSGSPSGGSAIAQADPRPAGDRMTVDLGEGITVSGEGPFEAKFQGGPPEGGTPNKGRAIRIRTQGRARVLLVTSPAWIIRPELKLDGRQWMAGWTDEAGSDWGRWSRCNLIAVSTLDGDHDLVLSDMVFPRVWERQFQPRVGGPGARPR